MLHSLEANVVAEPVATRLAGISLNVSALVVANAILDQAIRAALLAYRESIRAYPKIMLMTWKRACFNRSTVELKSTY